jgi:FSR family fosmidomycin resistance protein-like MFS transporter
VFAVAEQGVAVGLLYNVLAFAMQLPMGMFLDRCPVPLRFCLVVSGSLLLGGVALLVAGCNVAAVSVACLGNALFHVSAGKHLLETRDGASGPQGLFISTGALGLTAGLKFGCDYMSLCVLIPFAVYAALALWTWKREDARSIGAGTARQFVWSMPNRRALAAVFAVALLFVLVAWRGWSAMLAGDRMAQAGSGVWFVIAGVVAIWCGKALGGYIADRTSIAKVIVPSLAGSVILWLFASPQNALVWMALIFVAQLATGPVLRCLYLGCARRGGLAFGLNCLALFAGSF